MRNTLLFALLCSLLALPLMPATAQDDDPQTTLLDALDANFAAWQTTDGLQLVGSSTRDEQQFISTAGSVITFSTSATDGLEMELARVDGEEFAEVTGILTYASENSLGDASNYTAQVEARYVAGDVYFSGTVLAGDDIFGDGWVQVDTADALPVELLSFDWEDWFDADLNSILDFEDLLRAVAAAEDVVALDDSEGGFIYDVLLEGEVMAAYLEARSLEDAEALENPFVLAIIEQVALPDNGSSAGYTFAIDADGVLQFATTSLTIILSDVSMEAIAPGQFDAGSFLSYESVETTTVLLDGIDVDVAPVGAPDIAE